SRPAWSQRALDAPPLGIATASASTLVLARGSGGRKRSPIDVALAMQLRPGLGDGAESAWLVRFLMAFFGWLGVLTAGRR
ncbi:hypothetical protein FISHEDRAFT_10859, partial [Fistulina hepatica ATCC 64428]